MSQGDERRRDSDEVGEKISINDLGLEKRRPSTCDTPFGKIRHWRRLECEEWFFLGVACLSATLTIALTSERMVNSFEPNTPDFTFACLLLLNAVFSISYIIHGIFREDHYEITVFILTNIIVLVYVIVNYIKGHVEIYKTVRLSISVPLALINVVLGIRCCKRFWISKRLIFGIVGANEELTKICTLFFFCGALMTFDLQLQLSNFILVLKDGTNIKKIEGILLTVGLAYSFLWAINGYYALRNESKFLSWIYWAMSWGGPAYVIYKFVTTVLDEKRTILFSIIFVTGSLAIVVRIGLVCATVAAYRNFGKGYKEHRYGATSQRISIMPINA